MAQRFYIIPAEVVLVDGSNQRRPQYLSSIAPAARWGWMPVKDEWGIGWVDLTAGEHTTYNGSAGVRFLTADLAAMLTAGAVTAVQTELGQRNLPAAWVNTSLTWQQTIKRVLTFVMLIQRFWGETSQSLNIGRPVTTLVSTLSQANRDKLDILWSTFPGGALPAIQAGDTIETMMQRWADALVTRPIFISGVEL